jgi:serine/threonine protein kinase
VAGLAPGSVIGGKYRLTQLIGKGRASEVWAGEDVSSGQALALKLLSGALATDREYVERFKREAQVLAALRNPHIVHVHDHGQTPEGLLYAAMDLLQGESLQQRLGRKGALPAAEACALLDQVLDALTAAHRVGVVHRDIRPENVMLVADAQGRGSVKVLDFGAAGVEGGKGKQLTVAGAMLGTPQYAAPEQLRNEKTDARTDLYSVGCLAYALVVGEPPFQDVSPVKVMMSQMKDPPPPMQQRRPGLALPAGYEDWVLIAMAKKPEERFADASAMRDQLRRVASGQGLSVPRPAAAAPAPAAAPPPVAQPRPGAPTAAAPPAAAAPARPAARPGAPVVVPQPAASAGGAWKIIAIAAVAVVALVVFLLVRR